MRIVVASGVGEGPTHIAAFDAALFDAGVANYNLIQLSSIIPPGCVVERARYETPDAEYGRRLYVVMTRCHAHQPGAMAWAGVGWAQERPGDGRGLFVELHGESEQAVCAGLTASLEAMTARRERSFGPIQHQLAGIECRGRPVCALVVAVYASEEWNDPWGRATLALR